MATNFPASLDTLTNPSASDTLDSPPHDEQHADANDAIEALQAKVGVDGSAVTTSLDYKVANLESRPVETKTASYVLVAADVNKRIVMNSASATTITVNTGIFSAGDTVWIHNIGAGTTTVTAGTATVNTAGSLDVGQWEGGSLYFTSASSAIFFRGGGAGVANANFTDTATGTYSSGGKSYKFITFTASGTLTVDTAGLADILVVGGGGSGGADGGGGGGGGGYMEQKVYLDAATHTVVVGGGGASIPSGNAIGNTGSASYLAGFLASGGGGGGAWTNQAGLDGGSGGGGGGSTGAGGQAAGSQGNDGGTANTYATGAGGGGASAAGGVLNGGAGLTSTLDNTSTGRGGGGGGGGDTAPAGTASDGGGAGGIGGTAGTAGTANTGGGGGGARWPSGAGGSGVVIVRVEV